MYGILWYFQVFYYIYAIIGMEIFSGKLDYFRYETNVTDETHFCGNPALNGTFFYMFHYCSNNFNDILKAFVVLFELTVVNQWHDILSVFLFNICTLYTGSGCGHNRYCGRWIYILLMKSVLITANILLVWFPLVLRCI